MVALVQMPNTARVPLVMPTLDEELEAEAVEEEEEAKAHTNLYLAFNK